LIEPETAAAWENDPAAAFEAFYGRMARPLWAYLRRFTGSAAAADDGLQESFLRFLCHPPPESDEARRRSYLYRIATHWAIDRGRREKRERLGLAALFGRGSRETARDAERRGWKLDLEAALERLKPRDRALLWLAYVEGYDHGEIASILDLARGSVRVLLFRARARLEKMIDTRGRTAIPEESLR
jgi:RNA polymerase sigma-70 factor, ECF subfamily